MGNKISRELLQDVIDRILKHENYENALKSLNEQFPINYNFKNNVVRHYPKQAQE
jgi:hypothetical protein